MRLTTTRGAFDVLRSVAFAATVVVLWQTVPIAAQDIDGVQPDVVQTDVTTPTGSKGVMVRPYGPGPYPAILHLHGSGETVAKSVALLRVFARAGYVAMDVEYRQLDGGGIDIDDVYASLDFLKASRFVRKGLVGLNGFSLGARTALIVAANRDVRAVSAIAARTTGGTAPTILDEADRLKVPILLQHGTNDPQVPYQDSVLLEQKLKSLKRRVQLITYRGAEHNNLPWDRVYEKVLLFFRDAIR
jgi:dipeptidyl aminopeptidase/acylaminoacyl peptidase